MRTFLFVTLQEGCIILAVEGCGTLVSDFVRLGKRSI